MTNGGPLVSVCIGTYNREGCIRETLDSVFAQTYPHLEIIVVDDASTDGTVSIVQSYGARIRLVVLGENSGRPAVPRNVALQMAQGRYVAFLDSDDTWLPRKTERQVAFMEERPEIALSHGYCQLMDAASRPGAIRHEGGLPPTGNCLRDLLRHCHISISSVMVRQEILKQVGGFNEEPFYRGREDYELFLRIAGEYPVGLVDEVLSRYRVVEGSLSRTDDRWRSIPEDFPMHEKILGWTDVWRGVIPRSYLVEVLVEHAVNNAIFWKERGASGRALWFLVRALRYRPTGARIWWQLASIVQRSLGGRAGATPQPTP